MLYSPREEKKKWCLLKITEPWWCEAEISSLCHCSLSGQTMLSVMSSMWGTLWDHAAAPSVSFCLWHGWWSSWTGDSKAPQLLECHRFRVRGTSAGWGCSSSPPHPRWGCSSLLHLLFQRAAERHCSAWKGRRWDLVSGLLGRTGCWHWWGDPLASTVCGHTPHILSPCTLPGGQTDDGGWQTVWCRHDRLYVQWSLRRAADAPRSGQGQLCLVPSGIRRDMAP